MTADGGRLPKLGEKRMAAISEDGSKMAVNFQVTAVYKPFIAVSRVTAAGHEVWFGEDGGAVRNKANGKVTHFYKNNAYVTRMGQAPGSPEVGGAAGSESYKTTER